MSQTTALEVRGLTRTFGRIQAVTDLDLTVREGDVYGFLGPNGAGKTTAIRCFLGLIRSDRGEVRIFGESHPVRRRAPVGAIVETPAFHGWLSGRKNLEQACVYAGVPAGRREGEIARVLERVGLSERALDRAGTYSLGMKQRLGIARALLGGPKLLVLDEPTNGLDPRGMREMRELIRSLALHDRITIFISSHLLSEVQAICNRVGILQQGRLRAEGQVEDLLAQTDGARVLSIGATDLEALAAALAALEGVEIVGEPEGGRLTVHHSLPVPTIVRALVEAGVEVEALVPSTRSLEDVFLEVTR